MKLNMFKCGAELPHTIFASHDNTRHALCLISIVQVCALRLQPRPLRGASCVAIPHFNVDCARCNAG
jgi:hypothetical protein